MSLWAGAFMPSSHRLRDFDLQVTSLSPQEILPSVTPKASLNAGCSFLPPHNLCESCRLAVLQWSSLLQTFLLLIEQGLWFTRESVAPIPPSGLTYFHPPKSQSTNKSKTFNIHCHHHTSIHSTENMTYYRKKSTKHF